MKKLLPALVPILLIGGLVAILVASSNLGRISDHAEDPMTPNDLEDPIDQPILPLPADNTEEAPKTLPIEEDLSLGAYPASQYPFVNRSYSWELHKDRGRKYSFRFNSDGSVTQNFHSSQMRWRPNHTYSIILSSKTGWFVDVVFDSEYSRITGRPQDEAAVYVGRVLD